MDKRIDLFNVLKVEDKLTKILVYSSKESIDDPYEKNTTKSFLNPLTVKGYVSQVSFESLRWKFYGTVPNESVQIICEKKWENLFKIADKIEIDGRFYKTWKDDAQNFMIMRRENYLVIILGRKND